MSVSAGAVSHKPTNSQPTSRAIASTAVALVLLGEDSVDDDGMSGSEGAARLVLDNAVDALRRADAVVLTIETLRLGHAEQALALHVAAQVKRTRGRPDQRGNDVGERRFAGPR